MKSEEERGVEREKERERMKKKLKCAKF